MTEQTKSDVKKKLFKAKHQLTPKDQRDMAIKLSFQKSPTEVKTWKGKMTRLKTLRNKWVPFQEQIDKYVARKEKESGNLQTKINHLEHMLTMCPHPIEFLEILEDYDSGSYYDRASTTVYVKCTACGRKEKVDTITHSYYG